LIKDSNTNIKHHNFFGFRLSLIILKKPLKIMVKEALFTERYAQLNDKQREAVDAIYGPVMVIAGPGTGKTEVLSLRIANLLLSDAQVQPHEILCLTYTDEATNAMRRRLITIVGQAAHRVNICTFHAFCNKVIQENGDYFSFRNLQPISDLEKIEFIDTVLKELPPGNLLRKVSGNLFSDTGRLNHLFEFMKREHLTSAYVSACIDAYLEDLPHREEYIYKRASKENKKGDLRQAKIDEETRRMNITREAALLFDKTEDLMKKNGRYDFNDMILWVLDAFKENAALLQNYQERFQFILVDEFQDTNGAQNELLQYLSGYWEDPNIFVVGDDDQSIYEFQGARIKNITDFYERHKENIKIVVLPHNYRSSQPILDKAGATIKNNQSRLIYELQHLQLDKNIRAASARFLQASEAVPPQIRVYKNVLQEEADIVLQIERLLHEGVKASEIAILYAKHKQADNIIALMERKGIPYSVKKATDILKEPLILQIILLLNYLEAEQNTPLSAETLLWELIHAPYYSIAPTDIAYLSLYQQQNKSKNRHLAYWRLMLQDKLLLESLDLKSAKQLIRMGDCLNNWQSQLLTLPLPLLLQKLVYESGIVSYLLSSKDHIWQLQVLNTFFEFIKDLHVRKPNAKLPELVNMLQRMESENLSIPIQRVIQNENGVQFYTAHGAKGNEFEYVFLIGCTKNNWEDKSGGKNNFKMPDTITRTEEDKEKTYKTEVARRLFYVALTRAKKYLYISYARHENNGAGLQHSVFVDEISTDEERIEVNPDAPYLSNYLQWAMVPVPDVRVEMANALWVEKALQQFTMSYTALSKFLHCPLTFYYEQLLRVPYLKNDALLFGSAVHTALERMFKDMKQNQGEWPTKEQLIHSFRRALLQDAGALNSLQLERRMEQGIDILGAYYDKYLDSFNKNVEIEWKVNRFMLYNIPVTGKIDKIEIDAEGCTMVDYKTGDPDKYSSAMTAPPNDKDPLGGDYWRQIVFYKLLLENNDEKQWPIKAGVFDYIQKGSKTNQFKRIYVPIFPQDEEIVKAQLKEAYSRIMNHEFDKGCGKDDCNWCNFVRRNKLVISNPEAEPELDDV
jgi:DNA helicase-2/ATP-dependent DNA helicase PcrA